jgi:hypothetical protein
MSADPIVTYGAKMLADGYKVNGDLQSGYIATVPYLLAWINAFNFIDLVMGSTASTTIGAVTLHIPHLFPGAAVAKLYANSFDCQPCGQNGQSLPPTYGMKPGEFFTHAKVTITYKTPPYIQQSTDDPGNLNQLDPANPITLCEQSIKQSGKMRTRKGSGYTFADKSAVIGDIGVPEREAKLVLKFPRIPYIPWQLQQPFIGKVNKFTMLLCAPGTLLFEGGDTQFTETTQGLQGQQWVAELAYDPNGWNKLPRPDTGAYDDVYQKGHLGDPDFQIFGRIDLRALFLTVTIGP